jgi:hypothetical protein
MKNIAGAKKNEVKNNNAKYAGNIRKNLDFQKILADFVLAESWIRKPLIMKKKATQIEPRVWLTPDKKIEGSGPYPPKM